MDIEKIIQNYLKQPFPLWENEITQLLVEYKWTELVKLFQTVSNEYTIAGCVIKNKSVTEVNLLLPVNNCDIKVVLPSDDLNGFYEKHGIEPVGINIIDLSNEATKIISALDVLQRIEPVHNFILTILKSVQLIKAENEETDISYSHPEIPFSIFFSVCQEVSFISDLRVAESILHEAMHLKLTLIETYVDLIEPNSIEMFYSPWRDEQRPLRGVLHGIFVFKAIKDFYDSLVEKLLDDSVEFNFIKFRIEEIEKEFESLKHFANTPGLTISGKLLAFKLLQ